MFVLFHALMATIVWIVLRDLLNHLRDEQHRQYTGLIQTSFRDGQSRQLRPTFVQALIKLSIWWTWISLALHAALYAMLLLQEVLI